MINLSYKKYIFEFIQVGHFPLWSPSESLGYSLIFNPFAQYFYPLSWILYFICFLIGDLTKHTYLLYTIFGISIYNIGQYLWLRRLNIDIKYCSLATDSGIKIGIADMDSLGNKNYSKRIQNTVILQIATNDLEILFKKIKNNGGSILFGP